MIMGGGSENENDTRMISDNLMRMCTEWRTQFQTELQAAILSRAYRVPKDKRACNL